MAHNTSLGQAAGITDEQVEAIGTDEYMDSPHLNTREKAAVLWAEHVTKNTARSRDDVFEVVRKSFNEAEIVDLTLICCFFNMFNRVTDSLKMPIEIQSEVDKIKASVNLDPAKVRGYLETVVATWPSSFPAPNPD
jgi:hypothetical protein